MFDAIRRDRRDDPDVSIRELAVRHGVHRRTVRQALASAPPPARKVPVSDPVKPLIDAMLRQDLTAPRKQRHTALRVREPDLERGYRTPGGVVTTGVALVLAVVALIATFFVDILAASITAAIFLGALAYFWFYSRHHLVASAPEEEFALLQKEEQDLT